MAYNVEIFNDYAESTGFLTEFPIYPTGNTLILREIPNEDGNHLDIESDGNVLFSVTPGEEEIGVYIDGDLSYAPDNYRAATFERLKIYNTPYGFRWEIGKMAFAPVEGELHVDNEEESYEEFGILRGE